MSSAGASAERASRAARGRAAHGSAHVSVTSLHLDV